MEDFEMPKTTVWHEIFKVLIRFLILLGATVLVSVVYKWIIEMGFFQLIRKAANRRLVFCGLELLLLGVYWNYLYEFSIICRLNSRSVKVYYIRTLIVFALYNAVYWLSYFFLSREVNMWIFRVTYNLICFRLKTNAPDNLVPYMIAYQAITFLIMMLEPVIAKISYNAWRREMGLDDEDTL